MLTKLQQIQQLLSEIIESEEYQNLDYKPEMSLQDAHQIVSEYVDCLSPSYPVPSFNEVFPYNTKTTKQ